MAQELSAYLRSLDPGRLATAGMTFNELPSDTRTERVVGVAYAPWRRLRHWALPNWCSPRLVDMDPRPAGGDPVAGITGTGARSDRPHLLITRGSPVCWRAMNRAPRSGRGWRRVLLARVWSLSGGRADYTRRGSIGARRFGDDLAPPCSPCRSLSAQMHLDTVCTMVDTDTSMYASVVDTLEAFTIQRTRRRDHRRCGPRSGRLPRRWESTSCG